MFRLVITFIFAFTLSTTAWAANWNNSKSQNSTAQSKKTVDLRVGSIIGEAKFHSPDLVQKGRFVFMLPKLCQIIEVSEKGEITFIGKLPSKLADFQSCLSAADVEHLPETDTFLVSLPKRGLAEIDRSSKVIWYCENKFNSHDVDLLEGDLIGFVNGWDRKGNNDPVFTIIDRNCKVFSQLFAKDLGLETSRYNPTEDDPTYVHANAFQVLPNNHLMISLRNFNEVVILKDSKPIKRIRRGTKWVHDPLIVNPSAPPSEMEFYLANRGRGQHIIFHDKNGNPTSFWDSTTPDGEKQLRKKNKGFGNWNPLRTVERLPNGNLLVSGSRCMGQISAQGELVWDLCFPWFQHQMERLPDGWNFIYKVSFVSGSK